MVLFGLARAAWITTPFRRSSFETRCEPPRCSRSSLTNPTACLLGHDPGSGLLVGAQRRVGCSCCARQAAEGDQNQCDLAGHEANSCGDVEAARPGSRAGERFSRATAPGSVAMAKSSVASRREERRVGRAHAGLVQEHDVAPLPQSEPAERERKAVTTSTAGTTTASRAKDRSREIDRATSQREKTASAS